MTKLVIKMNFSEIEQKILKLLSEKGEYVRAQEISNYIGISTKTVYRKIKNLRELCDEDIIESHRSKGYRLNYEKYLTAFNDYYLPNNQYMSVENRRTSIFLNLLTHSPREVSINNLSLQYFVSPSSIVKDLDYIEKELKDTNLSLSKSNSGTSIVGAEKYIRKELMHIFNRFLVNLSTPTISALTSKDGSTEYLQKQFDKDEVNKIETILESANKLLGFVIENPYYINLLTHLLILLKRNKSKFAVYDIRYDIDNIDEHKYKVAQYIINKMEDEFKIELDSIETNYVYAFLISTRNDVNEVKNRQIDELEIKSSSEVELLVNEIIDEMEKELNISFSKDSRLKKSLLQHVQPMLNRIKYNVIIVNPIIEDIKDEFLNTFHTLKKIILRITKKYNLKEISDDEIGYLTVYFQNTIEKIIKRLNVLIVCTTGIGTSHLLKTRIKKNFPILNIKGVISTSEIDKYQQLDIDFILTTVNLPPTRQKQLLISALLDKGDINIIKQFIKNNYGRLI